MKIQIIEITIIKEEMKIPVKTSNIIYDGLSEIIPRIGDSLKVPSLENVFRVIDIIFDFGKGRQTGNNMLVIYDHACTIQVEKI